MSLSIDVIDVGWCDKIHLSPFCRSGFRLLVVGVSTSFEFLTDDDAYRTPDDIVKATLAFLIWWANLFSSCSIGWKMEMFVSHPGRSNNVGHSRTSSGHTVKTFWVWRCHVWRNCWIWRRQVLWQIVPSRNFGIVWFICLSPCRPANVAARCH